MAGAKTVTGARVICYINGQRYGRVISMEYDSQTPKKAIYGLDSTEPYELAPTITKIGGTLRVYRTVGDGGAEGAGMAANYEDLPREKYFTLQLVDIGTDLVLFQARECTLTAQSWSLPSKGTVTGVLKFEAISWSNEVKPLGSAG